MAKSLAVVAASVLALALAEEAPQRQLSSLLPAVYLRYPQPAAVSKSWYSGMEVTASAMATGFIVQQTSDCYLGLQQRQSSFGLLESTLGLSVNDPDEYTMIVIFAGWSPCTVEEVGNSAKWVNFAHGEGLQGCRVDLPVRWKNPMEHHLMTTTEALADGGLKITAYWKGDGDWELVGSMKKPAGSAGQGITSYTSFLEQFGTSAFEGSNTRSMQVGPHFVESTSGAWDALTSADYSNSENAQAGVYTVGSVTSEGQHWMIGVTGTDDSFIKASTPKSTLELTSKPAQPAALTQWVAQRDSNTMPTGCVGCGKSPIKDFFDSLNDRFVPMNAKQAVLETLIILFLVCAVIGAIFGYMWYQRRQMLRQVGPYGSPVYSGFNQSQSFNQGQPLMYQ